MPEPPWVLPEKEIADWLAIRKATNRADTED